MPISVRLIREDGETIVSATDKRGLIPRALNRMKNLRLLRYVDLYGNTYFNKFQMADLLADWRAIELLIEGADDAVFWREVQRLAEECQNETHTYVRFAGD